MAANKYGESKTPTIYAVSSVMMVIALSSLAVRFWARLRTKTYLWWDDWLALATLPFALSINILFIVTGTYGVGRHLDAIIDPASSQSMVMRLDVAIQFIMCVGATLIKLSALAFYARVFRRTKQLRIALWVVGAAAISYNVVEVIGYCLRCDPSRPANNQSICLTASSAEIPNCTIDVIADLAVLILPLPALAKLQLPWRRKLELTLVFILGCGFILITLLREIFAIQVLQDMNEFSKDPFWLVVPFNIAAVCEQPVGLLTISLPPAYPVLKELARRLRDALFNIKDFMMTVTGYSNGPQSRGRLRSPRSFIPLPSFGRTFAVTSEHFSESCVGDYGSQRSESSSGDRDLKCPEKVHMSLQEVV